MIEKVVTDGIAFRSKLAPYELEIRELKIAGESIRGIASKMLERHALHVSHNAVASFMKTHDIGRKNFLDGIQETRKRELLKQLRAVWTHDSTSLEGNTLTLGDTMAVLEYGLTVKGKPLKDHQDIVSHAKGVDFVQALTGSNTLTVEDVFTLHRIVIGEDAYDIYRPVGAWKREDNGTYGVENGKSVYMPYAKADETAKLMKSWLVDFNRKLRKRARSQEEALEAYVGAHVSFVRIHPFFDGNGRMARLLANIPVLRAGFPPIVVPVEARLDYIRELWDYQRAVGAISLENGNLLPDAGRLANFRNLLRDWWRTIPTRRCAFRSLYIPNGRNIRRIPGRQVGIGCSGMSRTMTANTLAGQAGSQMSRSTPSTSIQLGTRCWNLLQTTMFILGLAFRILGDVTAGINRNFSRDAVGLAVQTGLDGISRRIFWVLTRFPLLKH